VVRVSYPTADLDAALSRIQSSLLYSGLVILVLIALLNWWLSRQIIKPIKVMEAGAKRFARGKLKMRVPSSNIAELGNLADSLNQMADEIFDRIRTITQQKNEQIAILSSMTEGVIAVDRDSKLLSLNRAAENMFGIRSKNVIGRHIYEVIRHAELIDLVNRSLEKKGSHESRIEVFEPTQRLLSVVGSKMPTKKGALGGAVIVFADLTHIQRLEAVRREFVANVSHELKTPITSIQGYVETLQDGALKEPETAEKFLNIIAKHSLRLGQIVDDLLELSRIEEMTDEGKNDFPMGQVSTLIESCVTQYAAAAELKRIQMMQELDDDLKLPMDLKLMTHALGNLLDNAIKYSDEDKQIHLRSYREGDATVIEVQDHGSGIPSEHLDRIFERFYRVDRGRSRDVGGTGLGLSIVKHIARIHGAEVMVESELGAGTTFKLLFS
jgi:two-component system phosphate regulon sensor histidine kinase PhoR